MKTINDSKAKEYLFNLFKDKLNEIETLFFVEMNYPKSFDRAFYDKKMGRYISLEEFVKKEISNLPKKKMERIMVRKEMQKFYNKSKMGKLPTFSLDKKVQQLLYSFYQNEFLPEIDRIKKYKKVIL